MSLFQNTTIVMAIWAVCVNAGANAASRLLLHHFDQMSLAKAVTGIDSWDKSDPPGRL